VTCLVDLMRPSVGFAAAKLLEGAGCVVEVPRQSCCGQPAYNSGDRKTTREIAAQVIEEGRALIIALNKWDVAEHASSLFNGVKAALDEGLAQLRNVPLLTVSAKTGKGADTILKVAFDLRDAWSRRVPTGELNRWFETAVEANPPPAPKGQRIKLRYITQVKNRPPSFVVFGNRTDELPESYRRYLLNAMRRDLKFGPVPVRLEFRGRSNPFDRDRR